MSNTKVNGIPEIEQAVIFYGLFNNLKAPDIYALLHPRASVESCKTSGYNWLNTEKRRAYMETINSRLQAFKEFEATNKGGLNPANSENLPGVVDFTNKSEFIKYLNQAANRITDDKLKNDILKMLSDHLDFKDESKRSEDNQVQRFYLPIRCQDCKIYQERRG